MEWMRRARRAAAAAWLIWVGGVILAGRWFSRESKEVTIMLGFGLLFSGLARVDLTLALIVVGALLVRLAWPTPLPPPPRESPQLQPTGSSR